MTQPDELSPAGQFAPISALQAKTDDDWLAEINALVGGHFVDFENAFAWLLALLGDLFGDVMSGVLTAADALATFAAALVSNAIEIPVTVIEGLATFLEGLTEGIPIVSQIVDAIVGTTGGALADLIAWAAAIPQAAIDGLTDALSGLAGDITTASNALLDLIGDLVDGFIGALTGIPIIGGLFSALFGAIESLFTTTQTTVAQLPAVGTYANLPAAGSGGTYHCTDTDLTLVDTAVNEVQDVTITGGPTGGTFTLTYSGQTTSAIDFDATASDVQSALEALSNIAPGDVVVTGGVFGGAEFDDPVQKYRVAFQGALAAQNLTQMTASSSLTGGDTPTVDIETITQGVAGSWDLAHISTGSVRNNWVPTPLTGWTTTTLGTSSIATSLDARRVVAVSAAGDNIRGEYRNLASTSSFIITMYFEPTLFPAQQAMAFMMLGSSDATVKWTTFGVGYVANTMNVFVHRWNSESSFNTITLSKTISILAYGAPRWYRILDSGSLRQHLYSYNGIDWEMFLSEGRTTFLSHTKYGYGAYCTNGDNTILRVRSVKEASYP